MYDDASGEVQVYRVEGFEKVDYPKENYGTFFSGDSFIVLYKYLKGNKPLYIIYFWQGRNSSINEKGASALLSIDLFAEVGSESIQVRIIQQKETTHFFEIFKKNIIIKSGKFVDHKIDKVSLFDVRITKKGVRIIEIEKNLTKINLEHSFILINEKKYVYTNQESILKLNFYKNLELVQIKVDEIVDLFSNIKNDNFELSNTDNESIKKFTSLLEKKILTQKEYDSKIQNIYKNYQKENQNELIYLSKTDDVRMFQLSSRNGPVEYCEIYDFSYDDLDERDLFILDTSKYLYVWIGKKAQHKTIGFVLEFCVKFSDYKKNKCLVVKDLKEPNEFKLYFHAWEYTKKDSKNIKLEKALEIDDILKVYQKKIFSYKELLSDKLPVGIDETKLETYLSNDEFFDVFNISREEFDKLKEHKQKELKRSVYLF
jgi:hypothetical protein